MEPEPAEGTLNPKVVSSILTGPTEKDPDKQKGSCRKRRSWHPCPSQMVTEWSRNSTGHGTRTDDSLRDEPAEPLCSRSL